MALSRQREGVSIYHQPHGHRPRERHAGIAQQPVGTGVAPARPDVSRLIQRRQLYLPLVSNRGRAAHLVAPGPVMPTLLLLLAARVFSMAALSSGVASLKVAPSLR